MMKQLRVAFEFVLYSGFPDVGYGYLDFETRYFAIPPERALSATRVEE
jgi:hypothetical protein